ncbi:DUF1648 domain-containing protein [Schleiferilactobacillus shenzhenensis]|uniref:DUF1648 domain-containing protein n=1 Tax=Schleiferilactobacillus shenzhenensis LY-73 TaxID=1231336 RepID=U4TNA3_9LACO|nr:DUF1648 domain-containing protein [Schleiferilactobacillus shenzhenensis]ERL66346.1 hypothetical protein L248_0025 [Schleiferilactobacillus shenzhenensis LY-73]
MKQSRTWLDWLYLVVYTLNFVALAGLLYYAYTIFQDAPQRIPIHFSASNQPDGYGSKAMLFSFAALPIIGMLFPPALFGRKKESAKADLFAKIFLLLTIIAIWAAGFFSLRLIANSI